MTKIASDFKDDVKAGRPGLVKAGQTIEEESFKIIDAEMGPHSFQPAQWQIVRRIIHTTGDFDYARWIRFHPQSIDAGMSALSKRAAIITDTRMIHIGLSPWRLDWFGTEVVTPSADSESQIWAEQLGTTRSVAAFRKFSRRLDGSIVAIGNAPTALLEILRLVREEGIRPAVVIGVPVGFVQAEESKDALWGFKQQPAITILGRKGGSTVAVAILHALMELARNK
ncbi:MAG: precorrin-8X methylmutase [Desulfoferrobacter sp.]